LQLAAVNVLLGPNNAGKSALLRALGLMQDQLPYSVGDVRLGAERAEVTVELHGLPYPYGLWLPEEGVGHPNGTLEMNLPRDGALQHVVTYVQRTTAANRLAVGRLPAAEPGHYVVPYLSSRKTAEYDETVNLTATTSIQPTLRHLVAKLARVSNPLYPGSSLYRKASEAIFGFVVTAIASPNGQKPGIFVNNTDTIPIEDMGEGVPQIVGLLADLAVSDRKLFLIEEPENDVHPTALKALLDLIAESASAGQNQFVVSTHSNVVARHLGALPESTLHYVSAEPGVIPPIASSRAIANDPLERMEVLRELGYELYDFHLWDGWLILEEASAERLIRDYLIPWFAPRLNRVRTVAVGGSSQIEPAFSDFHRLFRFTHLEPQYRNRAWVLIDGDDEGAAIVQRLRDAYGPAWEASRFRALGEAAFERYYPPQFADAAEATLALTDKRARRTAKRELLDEVLAWVDDDPARAREAFAASAVEVVDLLREFEGELSPG